MVMYLALNNTSHGLAGILGGSDRFFGVHKFQKLWAPSNDDDTSLKRIDTGCSPDADDYSGFLLRWRASSRRLSRWRAPQRYGELTRFVH
jgi:hypothetical protein